MYDVVAVRPTNQRAFELACKNAEEREMGATASYLRGTLGPNGFSSASTAEDVTAGLDLASKTVIVTGATSGIGNQSFGDEGSARHSRGAEAEIHATSAPEARLDVMHLDLNSLKSVREFAANYKARNLPLNILLNNAGLLCMEFRLSEDGIERSFAVNHLGHFLLTELLLDTMKATAKDSGEEVRIVNVSSYAHTMSYKRDDLENLSNPKRMNIEVLDLVANDGAKCRGKSPHITTLKEVVGDEHHLSVSNDGGEGSVTREVDGKVMKVYLKRKLVGGGERINDHDRSKVPCALFEG